MEFGDIIWRQRFAEEYASFSQSRGGLGKTLGGVVGIIIILTGTLLGAGAVTAIVTVAATLVWLVGKEIIRNWLYRPFGEASEHWQPENRRFHLLLTGVVAAISLVVLVVAIASGNVDSANDRVYLFFVVLLPFITWWGFRTPLEFIVGVFLIAACAVNSTGGAYSLIPPADATSGDWAVLLATWSPFISSMFLFALGIREHRQFRQLVSHMDSAA